MTIFSIHLSYSSNRIIDSQVLDDGCQHHASPACAPGTVHQAVAALGEVVDQVQDVVDEVALGWDLEVRDGSVVDNEAALLLVELQQPVHAAVLLELVRLRQHKHHPQLVNLDTGVVMYNAL